MNNYIAVHYNGNTSILTYTSTEDEARTHLAGLITSGEVRKNHTLSIVRVCDDSLVYYSNRSHSLETLLQKQAQPALNWSEFWLGSAQELLTKWSNKLVSLGVVAGSR
ncbi:hypothetical protein ACFQ4C_12595 [Larkinella insperata]|uniref:Uncharacterized protein n=1 Tax=Larkinella insperata TaxID=332158 RepID=A0ABW3Q7P5_9BACT|nr:hypothetical protein [Larkinella insperata]